MKEKNQPGRDKPNESENQPQFASQQEKVEEAQPERELGSSDDDDTEKLSLGDDRKPPNADD